MSAYRKYIFGLCSFAFLLLIGLTSSCERNKKYKKVYRGPFYLGQIKDYLYFKRGSTWIFQNSLSGEKDTLVQTFCDTQFFERAELVNSVVYLNSYTLLDFAQMSTRNECFINFKSRHINPIVYAFTTICDKTYYKPTGGGSIQNFFYPFDSTKSENIGNTTFYRGHLDSLNVLGKYYPDVHIFEVKWDITIVLPKTSIPLNESGKGFYYWSKGYGLVKIKHITHRLDDFSEFTHSWDLLNSNLIK